MSEWSHLPNAKHIDRILDSINSNPAKWRDAARGVAWDAASDAARGVAWDAARDAARGVAWDAARDAARDAAWRAALGAAWITAWGTPRDAARDAAVGAALDAAVDAILALLAWDECAYLLQEKPEHVLVLAGLGIESALLLLPACIAMETELISA